MIADCHMHTGFSSDSDAAPEAMAAQAVKLGMERICITDHFDMDYPEENFSWIPMYTGESWRNSGNSTGGSWKSAVGWSWDCSPIWENGSGSMQRAVPSTISSVPFIWSGDWIPMTGSSIRERTVSCTGNIFSAPWKICGVPAAFRPWAIWIMWSGTGTRRKRNIPMPPMGSLSMRSSGN